MGSPVQYSKIYEVVLWLFDACLDFFAWVRQPMASALRLEFGDNEVLNGLANIVNGITLTIADFYGNPPFYEWLFGVGIVLVIVLNLVNLFKSFIVVS